MTIACRRSTRQPTQIGQNLCNERRHRACNATGVPSLRIRNDYFVIASFAFQVVVFSILNNWISLTRGPLGLVGIPGPSFLGIELSSPVALLLLVLVSCVLVFWLAKTLVRTGFGRVIKAIREDEVFALAAGKPVARYKVIVLAIGAGLAAYAGALYAHFMSYIDPTSFTVMESVFVISIVIIGGAGSIWGPIVGAILLVALPELMRFIGLPGSVAGNVRQLLYGTLLVGFMTWRPCGLIGEYGFRSGEAIK